MTPFLENLPRTGLSTEVDTNRWFAGLPADLQASLLQLAKPVCLQDGQRLLKKNTATRALGDGFAVVVTGLLKVSSHTTDGPEGILTYVQPGQWFGELALLDQHERERDVTSIGESQLWVVEPQGFAALMLNAAFTSAVMNLLTSRHRMMLDLLEDFALRSTRSRAARRLVLLAADDDPYQSPVRTDLKVSHDALASMLGITRPALAVQLKPLTQMGAIEQGYGKITITSMVTLMAEATAG